jgi:hypothetical protein
MLQRSIIISPILSLAFSLFCAEFFHPGGIMTTNAFVLTNNNANRHRLDIIRGEALSTSSLKFTNDGNNSDEEYILAGDVEQVVRPVGGLTKGPSSLLEAHTTNRNDGDSKELEGEAEPNPIKIISRIKADLEKNGYVMIPGGNYRALLLYFGATSNDLDMLTSGCIHEQVEKDREPNMFFRQVAFHRTILQDDSVSLANCEAVTQICKEEICNDEGAKVYFERSGTRKWSVPPKDYVDSTVSMAIARINDFLQPDVHHHQSNVNVDSPVTINDQVLIRVNKGISGIVKDIDHDFDLAEPTPEGIHQDGTEMSSVTLINRCNVDKTVGSESRIWKLEQPTGNYDSSKFGVLDEADKTDPKIQIPDDNGFDWNNCLLDTALDAHFDTIIFNDRDVKHEVRSFFQEKDTTGPCYRDVIVNFVRKPLSDGSDMKVEDVFVNGEYISKLSSIV